MAATTAASSPSKPQSTFLGSTRLGAKVKSVVRSLSSANLSSTFKSHKQPKEQPKPPPELPEKPRGRTQSMFFQKKVKTPYYGDTNDLRHTSVDVLAIELRQSFRTMGIQDFTPYDNPAMGTVSSSRNSSRSRQSSNPLTTPYMPTIIFTPERFSAATYTPSSSSPLATSTHSSVTHDSKISAASRGSSMPATPMTTHTNVELRFDVPTFVPLASSRPSSRPGSSLGMTVGGPYAQTRMSSSSEGGVRTSLSMPNLHGGLDRRPTKLAMAVPGYGMELNGGSQSPSVFSPPQYPPPSAGSAIESPASQAKGTSDESLKDSISPPASHPRQPPSSFIYPNLQSQQLNGTQPLQTINKQVSEQELATTNRESALLPPQHYRKSVAPSEMSIDGQAFGKLLTGFDEVDAQLEQIVAGRSLQEQGLGSMINEQEADPETPTPQRLASKI